MTNFDVKDLSLRTFWTAVSAGLAFLLIQINNLDYGWVPVATAAINFVLVMVRQQVPPVEADG